MVKLSDEMDEDIAEIECVRVIAMGHGNQLWD